MGAWVFTHTPRVCGLRELRVFSFTDDGSVSLDHRISLGSTQGVGMFQRSNIYRLVFGRAEVGLILVGLGRVIENHSVGCPEATESGCQLGG